MSVKIEQKKKKKRKQTNNRWRESLVFFIWPTGSDFVPFDRKENQAETKRRVTVSQSVPMFNPLWTRLQEGMKEPALRCPYSEVPHLQWAHRGVEGERKVRGTEGGGEQTECGEGLKDT